MSSKRDKPEAESAPSRPAYPYTMYSGSNNGTPPPASSSSVPPSKVASERPRSTSGSSAHGPNSRYANSYYSAFGSSVSPAPSAPPPGPPGPPGPPAPSAPPSNYPDTPPYYGAGYNYGYPPGYYSSAANYSSFDSYKEHYPNHHFGTSYPPPPPGAHPHNHDAKHSHYNRSEPDHPHKKFKKSGPVPNQPVYLLRSERFNGTFTPSGTPFEGVLEGAPELGFVVDLSIFGQNYKGFILNSNEYQSLVPPPKRDYTGTKYGGSNVFQRGDVEDWEEAVKGGRRLIHESAKPAFSSYPGNVPPPKPVPHQRKYDGYPDEVRELPPLDHIARGEISPREMPLQRERSAERNVDRNPSSLDSNTAEHSGRSWICYFENCRHIFDSSERFGEHIRKAHQNNNSNQFPHSIDLTGNSSVSPTNTPPIPLGQRPSLPPLPPLPAPPVDRDRGERGDYDRPNYYPPPP
eukprot:TRINITY_DN1965_c0_g1_i1.p1 TRINITY_DN1965_c0_g1~~TRINITY_DN1965_c0_g1_i1.p1  ORF type:complete len:461 (-),score=170.01 TRINITY_DN1965_c0_g1_i1:125-1507(-)